MAPPLLKEVSLAAVDWDDEGFAIPAYVPDEALLKSLEAVGILHPPVMWEKKAGLFAVVDGFKRLSWLRSRSSSVQALLFPEETDPRALLRIRLETKIFSRQLNLAEKAHILARYTALTSEEDLRRRICPALRIASPTESLSLWQSIAAWPARHLSLLARDLIAEKTALALAPLPEKDREAFLNLLGALRCSASLQMELLERCLDIARRDGITVRALLGASEMQTILRDENLNRREKTAAVRDIVYRWRFPTIHTKMAKLEGAVEALKMPSALSLLPPPFLEGNVWELRVRFRTPSELAASLTKAEQICTATQFQAIFDECAKGVPSKTTATASVPPHAAA